VDYSYDQWAQLMPIYDQSKKRKKIQEDDAYGPKIRHPSHLCLNGALFDKEKDKKTPTRYAQMYRDILLRYPRSQFRSLEEEKVGFKVFQISRWLLKHNPEYKEHYRGSTSHIKNKVSHVENRVKRYLDNLESWGLIGVQKREVKPNGLSTPLYGFSPLGAIIIWAMEYRDNPSKRETAKHQIYLWIQRMFHKSNSIMYEFIAKTYQKFMEYDKKHEPGFFDTIITNLIRAIEDDKLQFNNAIQYLSHAFDLVLRGAKTRVKAHELYREALDEFSEDDRKTIMYIEKDIIENEFTVNQPPRSWTKAWVENRMNHDKLVLYAVCEKNYSHRFPIVVNYYDYRKFKSLSPYRYLEAKTACLECHDNVQTRIYDSLDIPSQDSE